MNEYNEIIPDDLIKYCADKMNINICNKDYFLSYHSTKLIDVAYNNPSSLRRTYHDDYHVITKKDDLDFHITVNSNIERGLKEFVSIDKGLNLNYEEIKLFEEKINNLKYVKAKKLANNINKKLGNVLKENVHKIKI